MNLEQNVVRQSNREEDDFDLIDLMIALAKKKKLIIVFPLVIAILAAAISLVLPNIYRSSTKILPPQQSQSGASALLSQLGGVAGMAAGVAGLKSPNDLYIGMLRSRTIADKLISRFDLKTTYDVDTMEKARKKLEDQTEIVSGKDGIITVSVEDKGQKRVASMANAYVEELTKLNHVVAITEASQRRMFFENQLELAKNNLAAAEVKLKGAIDTTGVVSVDADSRAIVENIGRLRAQISAKEIQLSAMTAYITPDNPSYKRVQEELRSTRAELARLENGRVAATDSIDQAPGNKKEGLESIKLLRDVKYYQMLYELLGKQYEVARLDEAKDPSIIQVLDSAIMPERKSKPNRAILVIVSTTLALFAAILWALFSEVKRRALRAPRTAAQIAELKTHLKFR
jgi:uncharacterized protein involved in exopolysaccharide biosynthesis